MILLSSLNTLKLRPLKTTPIFILALLLFMVNFSAAQDLNLNPNPQELVFNEYIATPIQFNVVQKNADKSTEHLLASFFNEDNTSSKGFSIHIGTIDDKFSRKLKNQVPNKPESYHIDLSKKHISVIGRDTRGTYYGVRTLIAVLKNPKTPLGYITDYPDITARGTVEGFYGTPWSFNHRIRQIDFYGQNKLNTYIYGPKDDPYHSSPNWRKPYPETEANQLKKLIERAALNHVDFVWAIHPGKDIKWNDTDRVALLHKFELMYKLGVRTYAVFFDDISGEGTNPKQQADLLNYLNTEFVETKKDVKPLIMCPTEYNKSWSNPKGKYLETLGEALDPSIRVMWTGNRVVADIDKETMEWINAKIQRKAFIWWNFPVSDYVRNHMLLGPTYGNGTDVTQNLSGFVSNPMEHAEASKIAIYGVADYTWNMSKYQAEKKWLEAMQVVMPESYKALEIFARHNSDLGPNGHRYRRDESVSFTPIAEAFLKDLEAGQNIKNFETVHNEFQAMVEASYILLNSSDNPVLLDEIRPWIKQFQLLGQSGLATLNMYKALQTQNTNAFERSYQAVKALKTEMYALDRSENQNPYQPGIKTASLIVTPLINNSFKLLTQNYNKAFGKQLELEADYNPHTLFTNIAQLENQQVNLRDRTLVLNPPLEIIRLEPGAYLGFELQEATRITQMHYKLTPDTIYTNLKLEISNNGEEWATIPHPLDNKDLVKVSVNQTAKYIRLINTSTETLETKLKQLSINIK
ncbi:beta-N-acetylglucosaminidase domain-containing protein [Aestuariibaculum sp. M13]|uniref:beta-N-acetylglucosaminidase n=1 Tax=Aestuariibaculum sp. M13 TaxID=2967132 RepID=UPI002159E615|nr:beta-N-acetylglucosaminidase [Aestuariibaculum sp. M13]MCR8668728.1 beta-N-acetylglucosaminidase domain-containing protein [Aestuariibaculum sp. M13]